MKNMMVVAAVAVVAGTAMAAGLGPQNYVQDGLVTHFDAIDNEGTGTHNPSATTWRDLKGSAYITLNGSASWTGRYFDSTPTQHTLSDMPAYRRDSLTIETAVNVMSNGQITSGNCWPRIFAHGDTCTLHSSGNSSRDFRFYMANVVPGRDLRPNILSFRQGTAACLSCTEFFATALDGQEKDRASAAPTGNLEQNGANWTLNGQSGYLHGHYYAFRMYNRMLSPGEVVTNAVIDKLRFWSYTYTGTGAAVNWSAIPWIKPEGQTATAPSTDKTAYAQVANATANVAASDNVKLAGLSLEDGATLNVPSGAEAFLDVLYVEGQAVQAGRYTGTGSVGTQVSWISGAGVVHVGDDGFLQATGNQAINTGYFVKPSTRIVVDYAFTSATPTQQRVFGAA